MAPLNENIAGIEHKIQELTKESEGRGNPSRELQDALKAKQAEVQKAVVRID